MRGGAHVTADLAHPEDEWIVTVVWVPCSKDQIEQSFLRLLAALKLDHGSEGLEEDSLLGTISTQSSPMQ